MEKLFYPESIAIIGLSSKSSNIPRLVLENLIRWGYKGRIFGVNPRAADAHVDGIKMYRDVRDLPIVPDLVFVMIPARLVPDAVEACGAAGVKRMAIPTGGFNELGEEGKKLSDQVVATARKYGIRFVGPNGVTVANTANGLCLPFVPSFSPPKGGLSIISQSGGVGLMLWNLMTDDNVGMAKFASIGNKLDLDEVDFLEYFGRDPETKVIGMYLESIPRGERLIAAAAKIDKPVIVLKSNTTAAGRKAAMSHTAALANDEDIIDAAFERAGIIRIRHFNDFIAMAKAFELPPMRGKRMMIMSPAGGFTVMMADLCEEKGFVFADPGPAFYDELKNSSNAGVINFSNPLDMGDIYDTQVYSSIFYSVMHNPGVDGAVFVTQWPEMPRGEDVFYRMFHTDLSKEVAGTILSSGKPLGVCLFGLSATISRIKQNLDFPIFNNASEMIRAFKRQCDFYARKAAPPAVYPRSAGSAKIRASAEKKRWTSWACSASAAHCPMSPAMPRPPWRRRKRSVIRWCSKSSLRMRSTNRKPAESGRAFTTPQPSATPLPRFGIIFIATTPARVSTVCASLGRRKTAATCLSAANTILRSAPWFSSATAASTSRCSPIRQAFFARPARARSKRSSAF